MEFFPVFTNFFCVFLLFICGLFLQNMININKKSIFYGVAIPIDYKDNKKLMALHRQYQRNSLLSYSAVLILMALIIVNLSAEITALLIVPEALLALAVISINYLIIYKKVKQLKNSEGWKFDNNVVIVDTSFREKGGENHMLVISPMWFLIPLFITLITIACVIIKAANGELNRLGDSSISSALIIILVQIFVIGTLFGAYIWTKKAKQSLNGGAIGEIRKRSRRIRYSLSVGYLMLSIYISLLMMIISFSFSGIFSLSLLTNNIVNMIIILVPLIIIVIIITATAKQSNEGKQKPKTKEEEQIINRDDDQYYKLGSMYYNKNDPALFVEKRTGIGMTLNFAKPAAKVFMGVIAAIIIVPTTLMFIFMPGMTHERQIDVTPNAIAISGTWGLEMPKAQITKIDMENELPEVLMKTNGADIGQKLYGKHRLEGYNNSTLFIEDRSKPFIAIYLEDGRLVLINYAEEERTKSLYDKIISTK